jgi:hypothetical protein
MKEGKNMRKKATEYMSCGCVTTYYFDTKEMVGEEVCYQHSKVAA